jgi:hypothetical protein
MGKIFPMDNHHSLTNSFWSISQWSKNFLYNLGCRVSCLAHRDYFTIDNYSISSKSGNKERALAYNYQLAKVEHGLHVFKNLQCTRWGTRSPKKLYMILFLTRFGIPSYLTYY